MLCASLLILGSLAQLSPSPDPRPIPVSGLVVDASQKPVADADIWLTRATRSEDDPRSGMELFWERRASTDEQEDASAFAHARSDAEGRFRLEVPTEIAARPAHFALVVWAVSPGSRISSRRLPQVLRPDDPPIRLALGGATQSELYILGPDGEAITWAKVVPSRIQDMPIPDAMAERLAVTTDPKGRAFLAGVARGTLSEIRVKAASLGTQRIALGGENEKVVTLAPVGCIKGRLVAPEGDARAIVGVTIRVRSRVGGFDSSGHVGDALVACNPSGRFEVPAIAAGILAFDLLFDRDKGLPLRGELPQRLALKAWSGTEVMIPLRPSVRVSGIIREKGTGRPIAGVKLVINGRFGGDRSAVSDAQGKYTAFVRREVNQPFGWPIRIPRPFYQPANAPEAPQSMPAREVSEFALPTLELSRGVDLPGTVLDEAGKPVPDAEVEALSGSGTIVARSNSAGVFVLAGVDPLAELKITAQAGARNSGPPQTFRVSDASGGRLALNVRKSQAGLLGGRIVDRSRRPIAGASVRIWRMVRQEGRVFLKEPVTGQDGSNLFRTDAGGRYHVSRPLPIGNEYVALVLAVCSRMATKDLPRARRLADLITPGEIEKKPFALGLMALALAATDKPAALGLLDESFSELEGLRDRGRVSQFASISSAAAGLLPIVEQVDPDRLPEYLARAVSLRPQQKEGTDPSWIPEQTAQLAMMVARYDRDLATQVVQSDLESLGKMSLSYGGADPKTNRTLCALTLIDPRKAVDLIEALPESPSTAVNGFAPTKNDILIEAARLLSLHGADRWRHVYERYLLLWTPDQELR